MSDGAEEVEQQSEDGAPRKRKARKQRIARNSERHQARALAMQVLYEADMTDHAWDDVLERMSSDELLPPEIADYARKLVNGVIANKIHIDAKIRASAPAFPIRQMSPVDRNVLRIAIYELTYEPDVPTRAVINEAVEIAKRYGGDNSARFVNGVTGSIANLVRVDTQPKTDN